jgi:hypothetical protein
MLNIDLKHVAMQLCTCTWIEIMTGAGITLYLLYLQSYTLAAVTVAAFGPLIGFHFAIDRIKPGRDRRKKNANRVIKIKSLSGTRSWPANPEKLEDKLFNEKGAGAVPTL